EAITNVAAADVADTAAIKMSANWMAAAAHGGEGAKLYEAVEAVGMDLCPALGICVPVGKDSLSMQMSWTTAATQEKRSVTAPVTLNITAYAQVDDAARTLTPALVSSWDGFADGSTRLILVDLSRGRHRLGGSALAQVLQTLGTDCPDVEDAQL